MGKEMGQADQADQAAADQAAGERGEDSRSSHGDDVTSEVSASDAAQPSAAAAASGVDAVDDKAPHTDTAGDTVDEPLAVSLRVLAGRHAGASIELDFGSVLLGGAPHCEVVLRDDGVEPEHLLFGVSDARISIRVLGEAVVVDGKPVASGRVLAYREGMMLGIGAATIGLAPADYDWDAALARARDSEAAAEAAAASAENAGGLAARLAQPKGKLAVGAAALAMLLVAVAVATAGAFGPRVPTVAEREDAARDLIERLGLAEVAVQRTADDRITLVGYVPDPRALQRLRQAAVEQDFAVKAYPASELTRFATEWLGSRNLKAQVNYLGDGVLEVTGQDAADRRLSAATERLAQEVPGVSAIRQRIAPPVIAEKPAPVPAPPEPYVLGGVNGVNPGHPVPYISSGQSYIFSGGALKNGMTVMAIEPERVVVDDHGRKLASEIQVR